MATSETIQYILFKEAYEWLYVYLSEIFLVRKDTYNISWSSEMKKKNISVHNNNKKSMDIWYFQHVTSIFLVLTVTSCLY